MISAIAIDNLAKDGRVLGKKWFQTYGGWFSDYENMQIFTDSVTQTNLLPNRKLEILYVGSASGALGEELIRTLGQGHLTLVDISQKHLALNTNPFTTKLCMDVLEMDLRKKFDVVMMRSFLDYFPSAAEQIQVLRIVRNHMRHDGVFINQPAFIPDTNARSIISRAYCSIPNIGRRWFQSWDIDDLYAEAEFNPTLKYGSGKRMRITEQDHIDRYAITPSDVVAIQSIVKDAKPFAEITEKGYALTFEFPIFANTKQ